MMPPEESRRRQFRVYSLVKYIYPPGVPSEADRFKLRAEMNASLGFNSIDNWSHFSALYKNKEGLDDYTLGVNRTQLIELLTCQKYWMPPAESNNPFMLDLEKVYPVNTDSVEVLDRKLEFLVEVIDTVHDVCGSGKCVGLYGCIPRRSYWTSETNHWLNTQPTNKKASEWERAIADEHEFNERLCNRMYRSLVDIVDLFFPSFYFVYDPSKPTNLDGHFRWLRWQTDGCRALHKRVLPVIWWTDKETWTGVSSDIWRRLLDWCYFNADGVVLWNHQPVPIDNAYVQQASEWIKGIRSHWDDPENEPVRPIALEETFS